jgi:hypothetical protein
MVDGTGAGAVSAIETESLPNRSDQNDGTLKTRKICPWIGRS